MGLRPAIHGPLCAQHVVARRHAIRQLLRQTADRQPPRRDLRGATGRAAGGLYTGLGMVNIPRSKHPGGVNAGMCDGSVRFIKNSVNIYTFQALASAKGGEIVSSDAY